jgi:predicted NAD-dependent protein-ADP-ribosyltransferase YbiA (DUF1768 family)/DNA-directed RNA polymerase subunit M/transcription elongation factor TFIIS
MEQLNNENLFCNYCNNMMFPKYNDENSQYVLSCISCQYKQEIVGSMKLYQSKLANKKETMSEFDFDENDIVYDYSLSRIFIEGNEYVTLNDRNMKKIYINIVDKSIHLKQVEIKSKDITTEHKKLTSDNVERIKQELSQEPLSKKGEPSEPKEKKKLTRKKKSDKTESTTNVIEPSNVSQSDVFNYKTATDDVLFYYSKSADKQAGAGTNEKLIGSKDKYKELNSIQDWRKILSNFYHADFKYKDLTYHTAEHAFQGAKISLANPIKGIWFSVNSGHKIGSSTDGEIARKNRKLIELTPQQLKQWNEIKSQTLTDILYAKFSQNELPKKVLLATKDAILTHGTRGTKITRQFELEKVREILKNE